MTEEEFRTEAARRGLSDPIRKDWEAGRLNDTHTHAGSLFLYFLDGGMSVTIEGEERTCCPGETIFVAGNVPHIERVGPEGVSFLVATGR